MYSVVFNMNLAQSYTRIQLNTRVEDFHEQNIFFCNLQQSEYTLLWKCFFSQYHKQTKHLWRQNPADICNWIDYIFLCNDHN